VSFHEKTVDRIVNRLKSKGKYQYVLKNIAYTISEVDVMALRETKSKDYMLVFEVKPRDIYKYRKKAYKQLNKHKTHFGDIVDRMFKFYVIPKDESRKDYQIKWIK